MMLSQTEQADAVGEFAVAVGYGLRKVGQRELPSMYLYDELGTALFEAITLLPEYGLTRAEERLLRRHAGDILEHLPPPVAVVELGERQRPKDSLDIGSARRSRTSGLFPHRHILCGPHQMPPRTGGTSAQSASSDWRDRFWKGFRKQRLVADRTRHSWYCSWEAPSANLIDQQRRSFCATSVGI